MYARTAWLGANVVSDPLLVITRSLLQELVQLSSLLGHPLLTKRPSVRDTLTAIHFALAPRELSDFEKWFCTKTNTPSDLVATNPNHYSEEAIRVWLRHVRAKEGKVSFVSICIPFAEIVTDIIRPIVRYVNQGEATHPLLYFRHIKQALLRGKTELDCNLKADAEYTRYAQYTVTRANAKHCAERVNATLWKQCLVDELRLLFGPESPITIHLGGFLGTIPPSMQSFSFARKEDGHHLFDNILAKDDTHTIKQMLVAYFERTKWNADEKRNVAFDDLFVLDQVRVDQIAAAALLGPDGELQQVPPTWSSGQLLQRLREEPVLDTYLSPFQKALVGFSTEGEAKTESSSSSDLSPLDVMNKWILLTGRVIQFDYVKKQVFRSGKEQYVPITLGPQLSEEDAEPRLSLMTLNKTLDVIQYMQERSGRTNYLEMCALLSRANARAVYAKESNELALEDEMKSVFGIQEQVEAEWRNLLRACTPDANRTCATFDLFRQTVLCYAAFVVMKRATEPKFAYSSAVATMLQTSAYAAVKDVLMRLAFEQGFGLLDTIRRTARLLIEQARQHLVADVTLFATTLATLHPTTTRTRVMLRK